MAKKFKPDDLVEVEVEPAEPEVEPQEPAAPAEPVETEVEPQEPAAPAPVIGLDVFNARIAEVENNITAQFQNLLNTLQPKSKPEEITHDSTQTEPPARATAPRRKISIFRKRG